MERELEFPFERDRYRHELVAREGDVCLVRRVNLVTGSEHWEVVIVQHRGAETTPRGVEYPAREVYPGNEEWGEHGWTYTTRAEADARMAREAPHHPRRAPEPPK